MINLNELEKEWEKDCQIDEYRPDLAAVESPKLHSKYLNLLNIAKSDYKQAEYEYTIVLKKRTEWYDGHLTQKEMDELGWSYDPFDGKLVKTKAQKELYYNSDSVIRKAKKNVEESKKVLETIEAILDNIKWRTQTIRCIIDWKKFQAGF
jgi:hypothetical protein